MNSTDTIRQFFVKALLISLFILTMALPTKAQEIAIGQWRHHLPANRVVSLDEKPGFIYAATPYGLMEYDKRYNSIRTYDKVSGLSDFGINVVRYSQDKDILLMGYQNGNIDVMIQGGFFAIPDILQANILGSKSINNIYFDSDRAYLICDFGIVLLDLNQFVILDTWFIGPEGSMLNVYDLAKTENHFYAATEAGLLRADLTAPNLADFQYWKPEPELPGANQKFNFVVTHNNIVYANMAASASDTLFSLGDNGWEVFNPYGEEGFFEPKTNIRSKNNYLLASSMGEIHILDENADPVANFSSYAGRTANANDILVDKDNTVWAGDRSWGLLKGTLGGSFEFIIPSGPPTNESFGISHAGSTLWVAPGAKIAGWQSTWNDRGLFVLHKGNWEVFNRWQFPEMNSLRDIIQITPHPGNPRRAFAAAWSGGLAEMDAEEGLIKIYNDENSTLQRRSGVQDLVKVGGSAFDSRGNLWVSNSNADHFISVKTPEGNWMSYPHNGLVTGNETLGRVVIDNSDQKWVIMPRGGGILVFKEEDVNSNNSFDIRKLNTQAGNGSLPSNRVTALAKDKDGYMWVGTNSGVVVFYSPHMAFRNQPFDAQTIIVVQDGFAGRLFENETINTIFVDGSNKKWFGTTSSGAFLLAPDGRETLLHFNKSNSPLPSNNILDISVDPGTGEVFFATDQGLVSYRGFATEGQRQHSDVYAFPNPVRPGYNGYIAIKGLVTNARVKITDINGNLIHDGFADGGQFVWHGNNLQGRKPGSGVYLVFSTDPEGNETMVTKIMFIK